MTLDSLSTLLTMSNFANTKSAMDSAATASPGLGSESLLAQAIAQKQLNFDANKISHSTQSVSTAHSHPNLLQQNIEHSFAEGLSSLDPNVASQIGNLQEIVNDAAMQVKKVKSKRSAESTGGVLLSLLSSEAPQGTKAESAVVVDAHNAKASDVVGPNVNNANIVNSDIGDSNRFAASSAPAKDTTVIDKVRPRVNTEDIINPSSKLKSFRVVQSARDASFAEKLRKSTALAKINKGVSKETLGFVADKIGKLKAMFDEPIKAMHELSQANPGLSDTRISLQLQLQASKFSILVEGASKLVGQVSHGIDALLKGQ